jgi:hypothetical protein
MSKQYPPVEMGRNEQIREESRRALEYGQSPRTPISLAPRFRVEGLTPVLVSHAAVITPSSCEDAYKANFQSSVPRRSNPYAALPSADILTSTIEGHLAMLTPANHKELAPRILSYFGDLAAQVRDVQSIESLHKRVLLAVFGEGYFKNSGGREGSREARNCNGHVSTEFSTVIPNGMMSRASGVIK